MAASILPGRKSFSITIYPTTLPALGVYANLYSIRGHTAEIEGSLEEIKAILQRSKVVSRRLVPGSWRRKTCSRTWRLESGVGNLMARRIAMERNGMASAERIGKDCGKDKM